MPQSIEKALFPTQRQPSPPGPQANQPPAKSGTPKTADHPYAGRAQHQHQQHPHHETITRHTNEQISPVTPSLSATPASPIATALSTPPPTPPTTCQGTSPTTTLSSPPRPRHRVTTTAPPPTASPQTPAGLANKRHQSHPPGPPPAVATAHTKPTNINASGTAG